jgi:hypothetical protein
MNKASIMEIACEIEKHYADPYSFCEKFLNSDGNIRQKGIGHRDFNLMISRVRNSDEFRAFKDNEYYSKSLIGSPDRVSYEDVSNLFTED